MKLIKHESNYFAEVVKINNVQNVDGLDNLKSVSFFGYQALVSKDTEPGLYILFTAETELSDEFCRENNLYRSSLLNSDTSAKGYIEDNRRVRAIKLKGNISSALVMPLKSLQYLGIDVTSLKEGTKFNEINGRLICKKHIPKQKFSGTKAILKKASLIDEKMFPKHTDTEHFLRNKHLYQQGDRLIITQKLHGTSARHGHILVPKKMNWLQKILCSLKLYTASKEYKYVTGSRTVVKDWGKPGYYTTDIWMEWQERIQNYIPKDTIIYSEIVGFESNGSAIQKSYSYDCQPGESKLYIYRIITLNNDGLIIEWSWDQIKNFCKITGIPHVPELEQINYSLETEEYLQKKYIDKSFYKNYQKGLPLSDDSPVDEGICIRRDHMITKWKSPEFIQRETKDIDNGNVSLEDIS